MSFFRLEPRALSSGNAIPVYGGTGTPGYVRVWGYTQGVGGVHRVVYTGVYIGGVHRVVYRHIHPGRYTPRYMGGIHPGIPT